MSIVVRRFWRCFLILSVVPIVARPTFAQINWSVTHPCQIDVNKYTFTALGGCGNWFTAAARKTQYPIALQFIFLRSNDGGMTWTEQDAGLPKSNQANHDKFSILKQIDSLNAIAGSDAGLILRTMDGGNSWQKQTAGDSVYPIEDIDFSDALNGILIKGGWLTQIWITSDGGTHWMPAPFQELNCAQCHTSGPGHYKVFGYASGPLYTTDDNWVTVDSAFVSGPLVYHNRILAYCDFGKTDLMFAYGTYTSSLGDYGLVARTSDNGKTWSDTTVSFFDNILYMTDPDRDTIVATGSTVSHVLISFDHGMTWNNDTSIATAGADTVPLYGLDFPAGIFLTAADRVVAAFNDDPLVGKGSLVVGTFAQASVRNNSVKNGSLVYPNPTSGILHIEGFTKAVRIRDALGRIYSLTAIGNTFNVSSLSAGIYFITDGISEASFVKQ